MPPGGRFQAATPNALAQRGWQARPGPQLPRSAPMTEYRQPIRTAPANGLVASRSQKQCEEELYRERGEPAATVPVPDGLACQRPSAAGQPAMCPFQANTGLLPPALRGLALNLLVETIVPVLNR